MENVNDILKRQLLLMKFDSGVTLKENYEKISGKRILTEGLDPFGFMDSKQTEVNPALAIPMDKINVLWNNGYGEASYNNIEEEIDRDEGIVDAIDPGGLMYEYLDPLFESYKKKYVKYNNGLYPAMEVMRALYCEDEGGDNPRADLWYKESENKWGIIKHYEDAFKDWINIINEIQQPSKEEVGQEMGNTVPPPSGLGAAKQGWDMGKVKAKYSCLNDNDFAENQVMNDTYGDIVKLNLGKNRRGNPVYGKMYIQDGYIQLWDSPYTRIGNSDQYMACINNELSFQSGQNLNLTDPATKGPQMESTNKIGKLIREAINLNVKTSAEAIAGDGGTGGGGGGGGGGRRGTGRTVDKSSLVKEVQNKLKELDPTAVVSGTMDQETINKIMLQINKLVEKQDKEAEAKRIEDERVAAINPADNATASKDL
jgi:hypothetical protein